MYIYLSIYLFSEPDGPRVVVDSLEQTISFSRADKGLGLSIAGGLGSTPYKVTNQQTKPIAASKRNIEFVPLDSQHVN